MKEFLKYLTQFLQRQGASLPVLCQLFIFIEELFTFTAYLTPLLGRKKSLTQRRVEPQTFGLMVRGAKLLFAILSSYFQTSSCLTKINRTKTLRLCAFA
jgi:hypothetical protein